MSNYGFGIKTNASPRVIESKTDAGVPFRASLDGSRVRVPLIRALTGDPLVSETLADMIGNYGEGAIADAAESIARAVLDALAVRESVSDYAGDPTVYASRVWVAERVNSKGETVAAHARYTLSRGKGATLPLGTGAVPESVAALLDSIAADYA